MSSSLNNQNESPFGNPRFIVSKIAVFIFLWGWQYYVNKEYPQPLTRPAAVSGANTASVITQKDL